MKSTQTHGSNNRTVRHSKHSNTSPGYDPLNDPAADLPRHAKDDALDPIEYQLLLEATRELDDYQGQQARFVVLLAGRLGMRRGEITHLRESWVDWRRSMICVPRREPCDKGRYGGPCGDCRQKAKQYVEHSPEDEPLTLEQALRMRWEPKTEAAAREIPFDFEPRVQLSIERFFERYDQWPVSYSVTGRRITAAANQADSLDAENVYGHCLRASAATYHGDRGLGSIPLKALMGWASMETAQSYIASSGRNTQRALHAVHSR